MCNLSRENLGAYLGSLLKRPVKVLGLAPLGEPFQTGPLTRSLKGYGYGVPIDVEFEVAGERHRAVVETMSRRKLFAFIRAVLNAPTFNPEEINEYCGT